MRRVAMPDAETQDVWAARLSLALLVLVLGYVLYTMLSGGDNPQVRLAHETVRVDYEDGVSCYHRGDSLSCVYVPSRVPMGPAAPAVLIEDVIEPDTAVIPGPKKRSRK